MAEFYRCRLDIEVFFKELKQTLQISDVLGNSDHAIQWQIWYGLIVHLLLRLLHYLNQWSHSLELSRYTSRPLASTTYAYGGKDYGERTGRNRG